jgi:RecB family exonuclease
MPGERTLWTGSYGAATRDRALAAASPDLSSLWLAASPMARDQVRRELALGSRQADRGACPGPGARVWCWADLWAHVRDEAGAGSSCLSEGAAGAVFAEAIRQARQAGELAAITAVIDWPGYRRRLRARFAEWTTDERPARAANLNLAGPAAAEWAAFVRYRNLLRKLGAEDESGLAAWASRRLLQRPPASLAAFAQVTFLDWESPSPAHWRVLDHALRRARSVRVTMACEDGEASASLYEATAPVRDRLRELGFVETPVQTEIWRPAGLRELERSLFRRSRADAEVATVHGLAIHGAPQGEGTARVVAREVRRLLERGADPEDVIVLFRQWGEPAEIALEVMRDWGIPVHAEPGRSLGSEPSVAALLLAIGLPVEDWATDRVIRLLRNGQVRPGWPGSDPLSMAAAASVVKTSPVFRGREPLLNWLDRHVAEMRDRTVKAERARLARDLVERIFELLSPLDQPRPFAEQVERLFRVASGLGIGVPRGKGDVPHGEAGLDRLLDALEDQAGILDRLGRGEAPWRWADFAGEVESFAMELAAPPLPPRPGAVRLAAVDEVEGARAAHVILADLAEGTFPAHEAVEPFLSTRPGVPPDAASRRAFSREMLRFMRVIGSAESSVVLIYPTTDAKGQDLLRAGFLDELMEHLTPEALEACHRSVRRLDPALVDSPELAGSPGDRRVRAVALARTRGEPSALAALVRRAGHRRALDGTAAALQVLARRLRGTPFGEYDGLLKDGDIVLDVADAFPPDVPFSASQLETYSDCPFQFFCKYVLKLGPAERRDEIDEDYTRRGSKIHDMLQRLEEMKSEGQDDQDLEELERAVIDEVLRAEQIDASEVDLGLREIDRRRLIQTLRFYRVQHLKYESDPSGRPMPHRFEVAFGEERSGIPSLEIGRGIRAVRLQGKIDRIDIVEGPQGRGFRVIDYKSGHGPSVSDVRGARRLQLQLYAMAVERLGLAEQGLGLQDVGYWALRDKGYRPIAFEDWQQAQVAIESYIAELVDRLRRGVFVVDSQVDGCEGFCDFRAICRIRQARLAAKRHDRPTPPELATERSRAASKGRRGAGAGTGGEP